MQVGHSVFLINQTFHGIMCNVLRNTFSKLMKIGFQMPQEMVFNNDIRKKLFVCFCFQSGTKLSPYYS